MCVSEVIARYSSCPDVVAGLLYPRRFIWEPNIALSVWLWKGELTQSHSYLVRHTVWRCKWCLKLLPFIRISRVIRQHVQGRNARSMDVSVLLEGCGCNVRDWMFMLDYDNGLCFSVFSRGVFFSVCVCVCQDVPTRLHFHPTHKCGRTEDPDRNSF